MGCAACRQEVEAFQHMVRLLEAAPEVNPPADLWNTVAARLPETPARPWRILWWKAAAGTGLAAILLFALLTSQFHTPIVSTATTMSTAYVTAHDLLSSQDPLTDRASIGASLLASRSEHR